MLSGLKYRIRLAIMSLCLFSSGHAFAEGDMQIDTVIGIGIPSNSSFDDSFIRGVAFTYATPALNFRAGYINLGDFELENGSFDSRLEITGGYLELVKVFHLNVIDVEIGGGVAATNTEMYFDGVRLREENDTSPFAELVFAKNLGKIVTLHAGAAWFSDVSGSDITVPKAGIRFSF